MQRRNFIASLAGLAALPLVGKASAKVEPQVKPQVVLTHKESRSGIRCTDIRMAISDECSDLRGKTGEALIREVISRNRNVMRFVNHA